jgi:hypothetical protein
VQPSLDLARDVMASLPAVDKNKGQGLGLAKAVRKSLEAKTDEL